MERLTFEGNFCDIAQCANTRYGSFCEDGSCSQRKVWERLKTYEDICPGVKQVQTVKNFYDMVTKVIRGRVRGADMARLAELAEADKEGRVVVLPCKVGDTVCGIDEDGNIFKGEVRVMRGVKARNDVMNEFSILAADKSGMAKIVINPQRGVNIFDTIEEAKEALKERAE